MHCLTENHDVISSAEDISDPIDKAVTKYSNHPSIRKIRNIARIEHKFHFYKVFVEEMEMEISRLSPKRQ